MFYRYILTTLEDMIYRNLLTQWRPFSVIPSNNMVSWDIKALFSPLFFFPLPSPEWLKANAFLVAIIYLHLPGFRYYVVSDLKKTTLMLCYCLGQAQFLKITLLENLFVFLCNVNTIFSDQTIILLNTYFLHIGPTYLYRCLIAE